MLLNVFMGGLIVLLGGASLFALFMAGYAGSGGELGFTKIKEARLMRRSNNQNRKLLSSKNSSDSMLISTDNYATNTSEYWEKYWPQHLRGLQVWAEKQYGLICDNWAFDYDLKNLIDVWNDANKMNVARPYLERIEALTRLLCEDDYLKRLNNHPEYFNNYETKVNKLIQAVNVLKNDLQKAIKDVNSVHDNKDYLLKIATGEISESGKDADMRKWNEEFHQAGEKLDEDRPWASNHMSLRRVGKFGRTFQGNTLF